MGESLAAYTSLQSNKKAGSGDDKAIWLVFMIKGGKIVVESTGKGKSKDLETRHKEFVTAMSQDAPRYGVIDYNGKVVFVSYSDDSKHKVGAKMKYASVRQPFKDQLTGLSGTIQATDVGEIAKEAFDAITKSTILVAVLDDVIILMMK